MNNQEPTANEKAIEAYLLNTMPPAERELFEARLKAQPELASELEDARLVHTLVNYDGRTKLKAQLQELHAAGPPEEETPVIPLWKRSAFRAAAAVALLAILAVFLWPGSSTDGLFADHYTPMENTITIMSGTDTSSNQLMRAGMELYDKGQYAEALAKLDAFLANTPNDQLIQLYAGICQLETNDLKGAEARFNAVMTAGGNLHQGAARWYLALTYLKEDKIGECRALLERLVADEEPKYGVLARELLKELPGE